ncbi:MAG: DUF2567 domain-containing protein [Haloechinothrix sp.]
MPDPSVDEQGPASAAAANEAPVRLLDLVPRERPKVIVKADLLPAVSVLSMVALVGIPIGWLWAHLAPPQRSVVVDSGPPRPIQMESWHLFDDLVIFALLGMAAGVFIGALIWLLRERRGPVIMIASVLGSLLAGWLAALMGEGMFAGGLYEITEPLAVGDLVDKAPKLETRWVLLVQPMFTALTYGALAAWNGSDDLGRRLG